MVEQALLNPEILQSDDLIEAILSYNRSDRWNFDGLKCFLDECIEDEEKSAFYTTILPKVFRNYNLLEMLIKLNLKLQKVIYIFRILIYNANKNFHW